jgi:hypothetical protein
MATLPLHRLRLACLALAGTLTLAACSGGTDQTPDAETGSQGWTVAAAFYPLQFVAESVGGDLVSVTNLTKPRTSASWRTPISRSTSTASSQRSTTLSPRRAAARRST